MDLVNKIKEGIKDTIELDKTFLTQPGYIISNTGQRMKQEFNQKVEEEKQRVKAIQDSANKVGSRASDIMNTIIPGLGDTWNIITTGVRATNPVLNTATTYVTQVPADIQAPINVTVRDYVLPIALAAYGGAELLGAKATASAAEAAKVVDVVRKPFTNMELERVFQQYITRFPNSTPAQFRQFLNRNHKDLEKYFVNEADRYFTEAPKTIDAAVNLIVNKASNPKVAEEFMKAAKLRNPFSNKTLEKVYMQFRTRFPNASPEQFRQFLSRNYKNLEQDFVKEIEKYSKDLDEIIKVTKKYGDSLIKKADDFVKEHPEEISKSLAATGGFVTMNGMMSLGNEAISKAENDDKVNLVNLSKTGAEELKTLMKTVGAKKGEEQDVIKFAGQMTKLMLNAPSNIVRLAEGKPPIGFDELGLSAMDLWNAYKDNDNDLIGAVLKGSAGGIVGIARVVLGFSEDSKLGRWAKDKLTGRDKDYKQGKAIKNLQEYIKDEFPVGQSGRKYHVVGDRIYAYDTGKPTDIKTAVDDINAKYAFDFQQEQNRLQQDRTILEDFQEAQQNGYNIGGDLGQLINNYNERVKNINIPQYIDTSDYSQDKDIVQQVKEDKNSKDYLGIIRAEIYRRMLFPRAPQQMDYQTLYQDTYKVIADSISSQLDNYFNPDAFTYEYRQARAQAMLGYAPYISEQEFYDMKKAQQLNAMQPQIMTATQEAVKKMEQLSPDYLDSNVAKVLLEDLKNYEDMNRQQGNAIADRTIKMFEYEQKKREQQITQAQKEYELGLKTYEQQRQQQYDQQKLELDKKRYALEEKNAPYRNFSNIGAGMSGIGMSGEQVNNVIGTMSPEMTRQLFPGAFQQSLPYQQIVLPDTNYGRRK